MCGVGWGGMVGKVPCICTQKWDARNYWGGVGWGWRVEDEVMLRIHGGTHDMDLMFFKQPSLSCCDSRTSPFSAQPVLWISSPSPCYYAKRFGRIASPTVHWQSLRDFSKPNPCFPDIANRVLQMLQDSWNRCLRRTRPFAEAICLFQKLVSREEWSRMTYIQVRDQAVQNQWFLAQQEEVHGRPEVTSRSFSGDRHFWSYF